MESLYLVNKERGCAARGTIVDIGGRPGIVLENEEIVNIENFIPAGESGTLIWIQGNVEKVSREI